MMTSMTNDDEDDNEDDHEDDDEDDHDCDQYDNEVGDDYDGNGNTDDEVLCQDHQRKKKSKQPDDQSIKKSSTCFEE